MAMDDRIRLLAARAATESKSLWTALAGKAASAHTHDDRYVQRGNGTEVTVVTATTGTVTLDLSVARWFRIVPSGNITLAVSNVPASGNAVHVTLHIVQGATVRQITMPSGAVWLGTAPTQAANKRSIINMATDDGGAVWLCTGIV